MTGLLLDAAVALLLLATIFYCVLLNRRLTALRASYDDLQRLFSGFSRSIERAEAGITGLKIAAQEVGGDLQERIDKARALADELAFLTDRGDRLADQVADAGRQRPERGEAERRSCRRHRRRAWNRNRNVNLERR